MRYILPDELNNLNKEYQNADSREERRIKIKLNEIVDCYHECNVQEREFADDITKKFCELVAILKQQHTVEKQAIIDEYEQICSMPFDPEYISNQIPSDRQPLDKIQYQNSEDLLLEFYNYYLDSKSSATMKDYAARIKTFAYSKQYLIQMIESGNLGNLYITKDPVLFTYDNIELILARFNTKDESGRSIKQRLNIRSALRMLNEFKLKCDSSR